MSDTLTAEVQVDYIEPVMRGGGFLTKIRNSGPPGVRVVTIPKRFSDWDTGTPVMIEEHQSKLVIRRLDGGG